MNDSVVKRISNALTTSEEKIRSLVKSDDFIIPFLQCVREFDFEGVVHESLLQNGQSPSHSAIASWLYFQYGLPKIVQLYHEIERPPHDGLHFVSTPELREQARHILYATGYIEYVRRALYMLEDDLIRLEERNGICTFVFHKRHRDSLDSMSETKSRLKDHDAIAEVLHETMTELSQSIVREVDENVRLFHGRLIAYDSTPLLDDYFMIKAVTLALAMTDHDVFSPQSKFGGLPFEAYAMAISMQTMFSLKHDLCVARLVNRHPELSIPDCYTVTASRVSLLDGLSRGFSAYGHTPFLRSLANNRHALERILNVISAGKDTSRSLIGTNGILPHLIEFTPRSFIRCRHGARHNPYAVLRRGLARQYPRDYSKAQQHREARQLVQLKSIIKERFPTVQMRSNIKLRSGKRVLTDLDAVIVDLDSGCASFIQLKHQDPYGLDIRNRRQRSDKLISEIKSWLRAIDNWSKNTDLLRFLRDCGFKLPSVTNSLNLSIQVVSMHHAHFLEDFDGPQFHYETWHAYIEILEKAETFQTAIDSMRSSTSSLYHEDTWDSPYIVPDGKLEGVSIQFVDEIESNSINKD